MNMKKKVIGEDIIGSIVILQFGKGVKISEKKKTAERILKEKKNIKTVLEKIGKVKGRLRTIKTRYLAGEDTRETINVESGCRFKLDVEKCYFSPRLSNERLEVADLIRKEGRNISCLVMFAGVSPYSIIIAKRARVKKIVSVELGRECCRYGKENVRLNKLENVEVIQGDVKKVLSFGKRNKIRRIKEKFDVIVMPRPQLKDSFLKEAFKASKRGSLIVYYGFDSDVGKVVEEIYKESKKAKKKIEILKIKKAGEIAPFKYRWRVDLRVN